jgi:thioredoxin 1
MVLNNDNFKHEVEESTGIVLVDFFASWCGPCQMMTPVIEEMIKENKDSNLKIGKLNIDENQDIAGRYNVMSIPTFIVFKSGKPISQKLGYCTKEELLEMIEKVK